MISLCKRCLYPANHPLGLGFDAEGICSGCRVHEEKDRLDWGEREQTKFVASVEAELKQAIEKAENKAPPALDTLFDDVYEARPWHLDEQHADCARGPRPERRH